MGRRKWPLDGGEIGLPWPKELLRRVRASKKGNGVHPHIEVLDRVTRMREWGLCSLETKEVSVRGQPREKSHHGHRHRGFWPLLC